MDDIRLLTYIFLWGLIQTIKLLLIILLFIYLIYVINKTYPCRVYSLKRRRREKRILQNTARREGGNQNDNP